jgi:hypothetical protein
VTEPDDPPGAVEADAVSASDQLAAIRSLAGALEQRGTDYWLFGGWAVDFWVGAVTRAHSDVDVAAWRRDYDAIRDSLVEAGWQHTPAADELLGTRFRLGRALVEFTFVVPDDAGRVLLPVPDDPIVWSGGAFGEASRELLGVRARVIPLALLKDGKAHPREDASDAAKDRADFKALSRVA